MVAEQVAAAQQRAAHAAGGGAGGLRKAIGDNLPFAGPAIFHETSNAIAAGATVQDEIARLTAAGAKPEEIAKAREEFRTYSWTHSGVTEADYLAGSPRTPRAIAPGESYEMTPISASYRSALRASGLSSSEEDVGNVLRIMDELGLKTEGEREHFLNSFLKSQQAFGSQISTERARGLPQRQAVDLRVVARVPREVFPDAPAVGGPARRHGNDDRPDNYIGQHMQHSELKALAAAGFVNSKDLLYNKIGDVKGLKAGAPAF